ncbi:MAG: protoporphyrinogen oxidase, partial [Gemmatimonadetes bacterium]|nr:protoporphyrinogen oxidase [Gemmatimonadota bacterium]
MSESGEARSAPSNAAGAGPVIVVGGGIGGLSVAWALHRRGASVRLLESSPRLGGWVRTEQRDGYRLELGPQGFLDDSPGVIDLLDDLGLRDEAIPASATSATRYLLHRDRLVALPASPPSLVTSPLLSVGGKLRL